MAGIEFADWRDAHLSRRRVVRKGPAADCRPRRFTLRELPAVMALISNVDPVPDLIVIDGLVYLDGQSGPGLGRMVYDTVRDTVGQSIPVICVAKGHIASKNGQHRLSTLSKR